MAERRLRCVCSDRFVRATYHSEVKYTIGSIRLTIPSKLFVDFRLNLSARRMDKTVFANQ